VLSCAISSIEDPSVVITDVLPNLMKDWRLLRESDHGLRVLLRILTPMPSVFRGTDFQRSTVNEELKNAAVPLLLPRAIADIWSLGRFPDGSRLFVALMKAVQGTDAFQQFLDAAFTDAIIVDRALHKLVRAIVATEIVETQFVTAALERVRKAPELEKGIKSLIGTEGITGKAIEAILSPRDDYEINRGKPFRKGRN
jgi:hypothetical protein